LRDNLLKNRENFKQYLKVVLPDFIRAHDQHHPFRIWKRPKQVGDAGIVKVPPTNWLLWFENTFSCIFTIYEAGDVGAQTLRRHPIYQSPYAADVENGQQDGTGYLEMVFWPKKGLWANIVNSENLFSAWSCVMCGFLFSSARAHVVHTERSVCAKIPPLEMAADGSSGNLLLEQTSDAIMSDFQSYHLPPRMSAKVRYHTRYVRDSALNGTVRKFVWNSHRPFQFTPTLEEKMRRIGMADIVDGQLFYPYTTVVCKNYSPPTHTQQILFRLTLNPC
jgi:hypothetical protein